MHGQAYCPRSPPSVVGLLALLLLLFVIEPFPFLDYLIAITATVFGGMFWKRLSTATGQSILARKGIPIVRTLSTLTVAISRCRGLLSREATDEKCPPEIERTLSAVNQQLDILEKHTLNAIEDWNDELPEPARVMLGRLTKAETDLRELEAEKTALLRKLEAEKAGKEGAVKEQEKLEEKLRRAMQKYQEARRTVEATPLSAFSSGLALSVLTSEQMDRLRSGAARGLVDVLRPFDKKPDSGE